MSNCVECKQKNTLLDKNLMRTSSGSQEKLSFSTKMTETKQELVDNATSLDELCSVLNAVDNRLVKFPLQRPHFGGVPPQGNAAVAYDANRVLIYNYGWVIEDRCACGCGEVDYQCIYSAERMEQEGYYDSIGQG